MKPVLIPQEPRNTEVRFRQALEVPLLRFLEAVPEDANDPTAGLRLRVTDAALNATGVLHGGVMATLLDLAAYLGLLPALTSSEQAVTHAFAASYIAPASPGETILAKAAVLPRSRHLAFITATLNSDARTVATAWITKSILSRPGPTDH
jgi:uncharacterized protein (TIGR00369 family)